MTSSASAASPHDYALSSDLARLSLPQEYKDANRLLAWINSICCAFLLIGIVGLNPPKVRIKPLSEVTDVVPVIITPPEELPKPVTTEQPPETEQPTEATPDTPVVATVVAANAAEAAFAVPVEGPVILKPMRYAAPPPREVRPTVNNKPVALSSSEEDWGGQSNQPEYPSLAKRNGYQGTVVLEINFDASGNFVSVKVNKGSGYSVLDNAAVDKVKKHLRLRHPPGEARTFTKQFTFQLR
jgi:TonB family protein